MQIIVKFKGDDIMEKLFMNIMMDLWAGDTEVSYELFIKEINRCINNLKSYIGKEAHQMLEEIGIKDKTGMSWAEQDENTMKQIKEYRELLDYLETDSNWTL
jgi:hypothetical protein